MDYNGYQILQVMCNQWVVFRLNELLYIGGSKEDCYEYIDELIMKGEFN